ncbi:SDR family NAD(P)-dependent oxidoreductase [Gluconobacter kondonii]|uniref:SDR family NAD(P)-dependent oxidoreductase n=1 Tax=Gluconobacter kondonii TaxID=941463 RepID=UPI001B8B7985|nr:SDR family NAD(P)-dependent oxidoreductase [Gluconobacter kondonii]MBS1081243.1 SDR family oxidoreductase [Gluconobacter kondonii]
MTDHQVNNVAIVTGGSRGIGRAICLRLAEDGWSVAVGYAREKEGADEVVGAIRRTGRRAVAILSDVGDPHAIPLLFSRAAEALGPLGLFVANAGMTGEAVRIDEQTAEKLRRLIDVNLLGAMLGSGEAVRRLSTRHGGAGGVIILLSSVSARLGGLSGQVAYATTKGAIETFARGLANEVGPEGIRVVAIAPGLTATDMLPDGAEAIAQSSVPLRRVGEASEVAEAVAWAASSAASYLTGTTITVSGGR